MINKNPIRIFILGGGFGGLYTALQLSRSSWVQSGKCEIAIVERNDHFLFTPLLYELITGELQRWVIAPSYQKLLAQTPVKFCRNTVKHINFNDRQVALENGDQLSYDYLVLGVGTENRWVDIPGLKTHALTFRTLDDVERLQGQIHLLEKSDSRCLRVAVIGGGPSGVELSCKLADRLGQRGEVILIERGTQILKGFSQGVRSASYRALGNRRVQVYLQTNVKAINANSITITRHEQEVIIPIHQVIWVAGTQSIPWITRLGVQYNEQGKILTGSSLQLIDYPNVFALGDIAEIYHSTQTIPNTAQAAYQQANCVAKNLVAILEGKKLKSFRYSHLGDMLTLGKYSAVVSSYFLNIDGLLGFVIRALAYIFRLPTRRHKIQVLRNLLQKVLLKVRWFFRWRLTQFLSQRSAKNY